MKICAIDQSIRSSGITIFNDGEPISFHLIRTEKTDGDIYERINMIVDRVVELVEEHFIDHIAIESIPMGRITGNSRIDLAGLFHSLISRLRFVLNVPITIIQIQEAKIIATGSGKADKNTMFNALSDDMKERIVSFEKRKTKGLYDVVDSYWIGKVLIKQLEVLQR